MNLKDKTIRAFLWMSSVKVISQGFSWIVTILLARLLLPDDFGLLAIAWIFVGFMVLVNEMGIGSAIIQRKETDDDALYSIFWVSIIFGICFYLIVFFLAPTFSRFFDNENLTNVLRVLAFIFVIGSFQIVPSSLLTKELEFKKRSIAEFSGVFSGGTLSIVLALSGYGVWSLVYGPILRYLVFTILFFCFSQWRPKPVFMFKKVKGLLSFGLYVAGSRVLKFFYSNADSMIIGKILGNKFLGYYTMAFNLSGIPVEKITAIINQVSYPVFSKLQDDREKLQSYFLKITRFVSLITFPSMVGIFLVSESLIKVVLTPKWLPILFPLMILCFVALLKSIVQIIPMLLYAKGKPNLVLRFNLSSFVILPISFFVGIKYGVNGVACALAIVYPFLALFLLKMGLKEVGVPFSQYLKNLFPSIFASAFMFVIILTFQYADKYLYGNNIYFTLVVSSILGIISYLAFLKLFHRDVLTEIREIYQSLKVRQPEKGLA